MYLIFFLIASGSGSISKIDVDIDKDISKITVEYDNFTKNLNTNEGLGIEFNEPAITIKNKKKIKLNLDLNFAKIGSQGRKMVRCKVCYLYPQTVLINCKQKNHIPPICSELGTLPRGSILESHLQSDIHKECIKADFISKLSVSDTDIFAPINKLISNQNKKVAQRIGEFMCTIFNDAKRGTLSAWS